MALLSFQEQLTGSQGNVQSENILNFLPGLKYYGFISGPHLESQISILKKNTLPVSQILKNNLIGTY